MTITLHWWVIPIVIVALGAIYMWYDNKHDNSVFLRGIWGVLCFVISIIVAVAFTLGHILS